jgi:hypothetical protein
MSVQFFRLWPRRPPDGSLPLGISCDDEGLLLAGNCRLIEACLDRDGHLFYRARSAPEVSTLLTVAYGEVVDAALVHPAIERIAKLMTERNWSRAKLAALHLKLPELSGTAAAARVLLADALLKVTASFDPEKHPRWPKGSEQGHGGEFRPTDGDVVVPVSDPKIDGSKIQAHLHHWHDQALTKKYNKEGLLTPEAYNELMNGKAATSEEIYQDVGDPGVRIHMFNDMHRKATAEVQKISADFIEEKGITKDNPMTEIQAAELLLRIRSSFTPGISKLREAIVEYAETTGDAASKARARWLEFQFNVSRGGQTKKGNMTRSMDSEEQATCLRVANRLHDGLLALGLEADRDYWFYLGDLPYRYIVIGFCDQTSLTPAVVIACHKAVADEYAWGIRMDLIDPETGKLRPFATTNPRRWTLSCHEKWALDLGRETDRQMQAAGIGAWRNRGTPGS